MAGMEVVYDALPNPATQRTVSCFMGCVAFDALSTLAAKGRIVGCVGSRRLAQSCQGAIWELKVWCWVHAHLERACRVHASEAATVIVLSVVSFNVYVLPNLRTPGRCLSGGRSGLLAHFVAVRSHNFHTHRLLTVEATEDTIVALIILPVYGRSPANCP